jgi:hypothetical protein
VTHFHGFDHLPWGSFDAVCTTCGHSERVEGYEDSVLAGIEVEHAITCDGIMVRREIISKISKSLLLRGALS